MELARGDDLWIRGVGLNAAGAESRAERIIGPGWRNAIVKGKFLRKNRQGRVQVKLDSGETVWVGPEFLSSEAVEGGEGPEGGLGDVLPDQDLGSDEEERMGSRKREKSRGPSATGTLEWRRGGSVPTLRRTSVCWTGTSATSRAT